MNESAEQFGSDPVISDPIIIDKGKIISGLLVDFQQLENCITAFERDNLLLRKENAELRERLSKYEKPKNSRNSFIPQSKDENRPRKNQSLRKASGKKPGGENQMQGVNFIKPIN